MEKKTYLINERSLSREIKRKVKGKRSCRRGSLSHSPPRHSGNHEMRRPRRRPSLMTMDFTLETSRLERLETENDNSEDFSEPQIKPIDLEATWSQRKTLKMQGNFWSWPNYGSLANVGLPEWEEHWRKFYEGTEKDKNTDGIDHEGFRSRFNINLLDSTMPGLRLDSSTRIRRRIRERISRSSSRSIGLISGLSSSSSLRVSRRFSRSSSRSLGTDSRDISSLNPEEPDDSSEEEEIFLNIGQIRRREKKKKKKNTLEEQKDGKKEDEKDNWESDEIGFNLKLN